MRTETTNQSSGEENPVSLVQEFLIGSASPEGFSGESPSHEVVREAIRLLREDREMGLAFISALGLDVALRDGTFPDKVYDLSEILREIDKEKALLGLVLSRIYESENPSRESRILKAFTGAGRFQFFMMLEMLSAFVSEAEIQAEIIAPFFKEVRRVLGNDVASAEFWNALEALARRRPQSAVATLERWLQESLDEESTSMCAGILGIIRATGVEESRRLDAATEGSLKLEYRRVFIRSWITTDRVSSIEDVQFRAILDFAEKGSTGDILEVFNFLRHVLPRPERCDASFSCGLGWVLEKVPSEPEDYLRHQIIDLALACDARADQLLITPIRTKISGLLPIPSEFTRTWKILGRLLAELFERDQNAGSSLLGEVYRADKKGVFSQFDNEESWIPLFEVLKRKGGEDLVVNLLSSVDTDERRLGFALFGRLDLDRLPEENLNQWSGNWLAVLILQVGIVTYDSGTIARFLLAILDRVARSVPDLAALYCETLVFHMKDMPGEFMSAIKLANEVLKSTILEEALQEAESYFDRLRECSDSPINSIGVPGYSRALRLLNARRSKQFAEGVEKGSALLKLMPKSYLLYGGMRWRTYMNGQMGEPTEMQGHSTSMEMPRLHIMHPDELARRRRHLVKEIARLVRLEGESTDEGAE